jgi:hypothetical protein
MNLIAHADESRSAPEERHRSELHVERPWLCGLEIDAGWRLSEVLAMVTFRSPSSSGAEASLCGVGARVTAQEKVRRDARVVADRARGFGWRTIAARHGLCERQCRAIWAERRSGGVDLLAGDPMESLHEAADQLDALIEDCAVLAEATANDSVRVAAIKERRALMGERIALQQACGLLPRNLRLLRTEQEMRNILERVIEILVEHEVGEDVLRAIHDAAAQAVERKSYALPAGR